MSDKTKPPKKLPHPLKPNPINEENGTILQSFSKEKAKKRYYFQSARLSIYI
ncbi:hypothetical protein [Methanocalculus sp.]|uniref:hypothetical protein n=1 Tax=Methanocalculus sp. TaxID=2004547 RepID=UPI002608B12D|nr:hypothetical protein [Methanocalculus sp.]MDG6251259.1 hypothetical protein [Methanocalculus sp.]